MNTENEWCQSEMDSMESDLKWSIVVLFYIVRCCYCCVVQSWASNLLTNSIRKWTIESKIHTHTHTHTNTNTKRSTKTTKQRISAKWDKGAMVLGIILVLLWVLFFYSFLIIPFHSFFTAPIYYKHIPTYTHIHCATLWSKRAFPLFYASYVTVACCCCCLFLIFLFHFISVWCVFRSHLNHKSISVTLT